MSQFLLKNFLTKVLYESGIIYPSSINLSYFWSFGVFSLISLFIQLITGIFLAMHYIPNVDLAFYSVEHIMRDVNFGWLLRYLHANGASFFFVAVYCHIFRGLFYSSYIYPRQMLWVIGVLIFLLMILSAFLGYVLPWGQMSFWAATVITNLASAIPYFGFSIVIWLWGGFAVDNPTLNRFFSFHFLFPFIILALVFLHLIFLHEAKSNNPLGVKPIYDNIPFSPYYIIKDFFAVIWFFIFLSIFVFFIPNYLGHTDNYIEANPMVTPTHIVPEWYFLPFYAILRSVPDKLGGVFLMIFSIIILGLIPFLHKINIRSSIFKPLHKIFFWIFLANWFILGWLGGCPIESPFFELGMFCSFFYFFYFIFILTILLFLENIFFYFLKK